MNVLKMIAYRRVLLFLFALAFATSSLPALPHVPYSMDTVISYSELDDTEKRVMDELHEGATNHDSVIRFKNGVSRETLSKLLELLYTDYPELIAVDRKYSYTLNLTTGKVSTVRLRFLFDKEKEQEMQKAMLKVAADIVRSAPEGEYQKEIYFHDAICSLVTYSTDLDDELNHTAYGALIEGNAVCDGYSKAMALLCRLALIKCSVISGMSYNGDTTGFHAWNLMCINGTYTLSDLTWNDFREYVRYDYFNVTEREMNIDHRQVYDHSWPKCDSYAVNWHMINNLYIGRSTNVELRRLVDTYLRFTAETGRTISLRFEEYSTYRRFKENFQTWFASSMKRRGLDFTYWISPNDRQQCFAIRKVD